MREIGSDFHFVPWWPGGRHGGPDVVPTGYPDTAYLASGRDALHWIIGSLRLPVGAEVLLPAYLCEEVLNPFLAHGMRVRFYGVTRDLQVDTADLAAKLSPETRALLFIDYYGFRLQLPTSLIESAGSHTVVVENATHSFLSQPDHSAVRGQVRFASYRKLLPLPNGAVVSWDARRLPAIAPVGTRMSVRYMGALWSRCAGAALKTLWLQRPAVYPKAVFRKLFSLSENLLDTYSKPAGMARISRRMLRSLDLEEIVEARRRNYRYLLERLDFSDDLRPLYPNLADGVCPLGFPVLVGDRDSLMSRLISKGVYATVHWELPAAVDRQEFPDAWHVSDHVLTIPVDQRYVEEDMARIVELVSSHKREQVPWAAGR